MFGLGSITGSNSAVFNPENDIPSLAGKIILVTGGSSGLGKQSIIYLARKKPSEIWFTSRTRSEADETFEDIRKHAPDTTIKHLTLDLGSFKSIQSAAQFLLSRITRLDILMLNAGVMGIAPGLTEDGYEIQFGINYLGHALLTKLLLPILKVTASEGHAVRVVILSSYSHWNAPKWGIQFQHLKTTAEQIPTLQRYAQSKLANILLARQLAKEHPEVTSVAVHPGAADTDLQAGVTGIGLMERILNATINRFLLYQPVETVAKHQVWAATTIKELVNGEYYDPIGLPGKRRPEATNEDLAKRLWNWTEEELKAFSTLESEACHI
ncbi:unnamed protein product [Clonostachys rosea f. rosea IK726]|uniref:Oxidoreductase n=2 Tax=Bionectria ochroleuca TaxID=29856 RepID=A0A0B7K292_BIOOC|nr:unnamed protein product [Clonostachys rosea f. rosea IK726]